MTTLDKSIAEFVEAWGKLVRKAKNCSYTRRGGCHKTVEVTVAEVLAQGNAYLTDDSAIVRDESGDIWIIPETKETNELVSSRYDLRPGMRLRLEIKETVLVERETRVYPL